MDLQRLRSLAETVAGYNDPVGRQMALWEAPAAFTDALTRSRVADPYVDACSGCGYVWQHCECEGRR